MPRLHPPRLFVVGSSLAVLLAGCGGHAGPTTHAAAHDIRVAQRAAGYRLYWDGRSLQGLALTDVLRSPDSTTLIYGTCTPVGEEPSCTPPLQIEVASICASNALLLDVRPSARFAARGVSVLDYGEGQIELATGTSNVVVRASRAIARRAISALRPLTSPHRPHLPTARYPRYYVTQLRRVHDAYAHRHSLRAVRDQLGISRSAVRFELGLANQLGTIRLHRDGHGAPTLQQVKRDRLAATLSDEQGEQSTGRALGITPSQVHSSAQRGRDQRNGCPLEPAPH